MVVPPIMPPPVPSSPSSCHRHSFSITSVAIDEAMQPSPLVHHHRLTSFPLPLFVKPPTDRTPPTILGRSMPPIHEGLTSDHRHPSMPTPEWSKSFLLSVRPCYHATIPSNPQPMLPCQLVPPCLCILASSTSKLVEAMPVISTSSPLGLSTSSQPWENSFYMNMKARGSLFCMIFEANPRPLLTSIH